MIEKFKKISVIGRIAYGIMCAEEYLIVKYPKKSWDIVFEKYWEVTNLRYWDEWMDEVMEYIPEYLFEFDNYEDSNFEYLKEEKYNELKNLYENISSDSDVNTILKMVWSLANSHAYASINGYGKESLDNLNAIILFLENNNINLPDFTKIDDLLFLENKGWGIRFDGKYLSKTLK
ncbi:MAG: hypothetical protein HFE57_13675 [Firmicutes bacterium]|jgi:hypothetical protein|nr:hypothetical protein [Bacillota bacterium]